MISKATEEERRLLQAQGYSWRVLKFPARITWYKPDGTHFESIGEQANRLINLRKGYRLDPPTPEQVAAYKAKTDVQLAPAEGNTTGQEDQELNIGEIAMQSVKLVASHHHIYNRSGQHCTICGQVRQRAYKARERREHKEA